MKKTLLLTLMTMTLFSQVEARALFGKVEKYIEIKTGDLVEISSRESAKEGVVTFYDYVSKQKRTMDMSELSKSTNKEIAGVRAGKTALIKTKTANSETQNITRYCKIVVLFESQQALAGCKSYQADATPGRELPLYFYFVVNNVEEITAEVSELEGFLPGENVQVGTQKMSIVSIFANGEAIVQKPSVPGFETQNIFEKNNLVRVKLSDLTKLD